MAPVAYPKVPATAWKTLRLRAANAPSTRFTASTVAALLNMANPRSATDNIITPLRRLGLIDEDGSLTARGNKWRIDSTYAEACQEILDEVYPSDLMALTDDLDKPDKQRINTWMQHQGFGGSNARQMAATYALIAEKKVPDVGNESSKANTTSRQPKPKRDKAAPTASNVERRVTDGPAAAPLVTPAPHVGPNIHLDIQIHIPADANPDQIDHIFASMAKHLYQR